MATFSGKIVFSLGKILREQINFQMKLPMKITVYTFTWIYHCGYIVDRFLYNYITIHGHHVY